MNSVLQEQPQDLASYISCLRTVCLNESSKSTNNERRSGDGQETARRRPGDGQETARRRPETPGDGQTARRRPGTTADLDHHLGINMELSGVRRSKISVEHWHQMPLASLLASAGLLKQLLILTLRDPPRPGGGGVGGGWGRGELGRTLASDAVGVWVALCYPDTCGPRPRRMSKRTGTALRPLTQTDQTGLLLCDCAPRMFAKGGPLCGAWKVVEGSLAARIPKFTCYSGSQNARAQLKFARRMDTEHY